MDLIIENVCDFFKIDKQKVIDKSNKQDICIIRNYIYYILHYEYNFSITQIAKKFNRCRREISYRISEAKFRIGYFKPMQQEYSSIIKYLDKKKGEY